MTPVTTPDEAAAQLAGFRYVVSEFIYRPRPVEPRARAVFDYALRSRWDEVRQERGALLLLCRDEAAFASLTPLLDAYPDVAVVTAVVNPPLADANDAIDRTPWWAEWGRPERWRRVALTDRWARIRFALDVGRRLDDGFLVMPANDAVWGYSLLADLTALSYDNARGGVPAAVSPYTGWQHSPVPGVDIAPLVIAALDAGFNRDGGFRAQVESGRAQGFWGKTGLLPYAVCDTLLHRCEMGTWEDDLEIDRVLKESGYAVRCWWVEQRVRYCQALPVFDRADIYRVFERTLHYSLNLPAERPAGTSLLYQPLDASNQFRRQVSRRYAAAVSLSEAVIAECGAALSERLTRYGCSWVDWGDYRYVARVGDPWVQVWTCSSDLL